MADTDIPDDLRPRGIDDHDRIRDPRYQIALRDQTIAALRRELAARTEQLDAARKALWLTWLNGHDFNFNEQDKKMINAQLDLAAEASK